MEKNLEKEKAINSKKPIIIGIIAAVVIVATIVLIIVLRNRDKLSATTMRLLRIKGTVTMTENGKEKKIIENIKIRSGNILTTAENSLASIGLDDSKLVTLEEESQAKFNQSGKKLKLNLKTGRLFFEVKEKLKKDEDFSISTSTMVVGIRGTSGYVIADNEGQDKVLITDGEVKVTGYNKKTGQKKYTVVRAGEMVSVYLYDDPDNSVDFKKIVITEDNVP
ncbi:MAG: FecR family protein, partial [Lachnospiraceae bacterium]|nr:FecR family protein [Lachnospiraceae bacterium]